MSEINKEKMGSFIAELRKEKGMTQKELADRLFISAKAVSKWETGVSVPSVDILLPLADILGISVTELLKSERIKNDLSLDKQNVEELVRQAITMNEEDKHFINTNRKDNIRMFVICCLLELAEIFILVKTDFNSYYIADFIPFMTVGVVLRFYFTFIVKDRIPTFYDENKINFYSDGFMRINMPGLYFNNSNWPYISNYVRK